MHVTLIHLLAQKTDRSTGGALMWSFILIGIILVLFGAIVLYRRWMNSNDTTSNAGFTLSDLRRLHKEGKMTDAEFESAKAILIGSLKAAAARSASNTAPKGAQGPRTNPPGFDVLPPDQ
jgi:LPXTG-motif cell wall-anchored protein